MNDDLLACLVNASQELTKARRIAEQSRRGDIALEIVEARMCVIDAVELLVNGKPKQEAA